ncbi:DEAD/DEAH box helicase family protein [Acidithiobacillus sp.]
MVAKKEEAGKKLIAPYYQKHQKILGKYLDDLKRRVAQLDMDLASDDKHLAFFNEVREGVTQHPLRDYQLDALYTLHHIYEFAEGAIHAPKTLNLKQYEHVRELLDEVDDDSGRKAPFIGFEMATGSGKTMLMGAALYYLNKVRRIRHFLIITPSSTEIYKKTIRNFTVGNPQSVWADDAPFRFNLITGDNYKDYGTLLDGDEDAWIFVFNIDKFGTNATNTKKPWESSIWKDATGNTISLLEFLAQEDLVIITDEAHHAQSRTARNLIQNFRPQAVLEFTATAVEAQRGDAKKNQTIVYKYDIRRFLEEKYGKLVRVLALQPSKKTKGKPTELLEVERLKLQTFFLVHLVKQRALLRDQDCRGLKALGFVKVKNDIAYAEKVEAYIRERLADDTESLNVILEKAKAQDLEITNLIVELFEQEFGGDIGLLQQAISDSAQRSILLHSKADPLVKRQFDTIQTNDIEIVIYINMLDEGIDMPNIYTMVVINDNPTEFKTAVKQIVGRGVRLNKEQRRFDEETRDTLLTQAEKLHVVCDEDAAFQEIIESIQQDFGLEAGNKLFAFERGDEKPVDNQPKTELLKGVYLPKVRVSFKRRDEVSIMNVIGQYEVIVDEFLRYNCFAKEESGGKYHYLKGYKPNTFFTEIDLFQDLKTFEQVAQQEQWNPGVLRIEERDLKAIYSRVVSKIHAIPDVPATYQTFQRYQQKINSLELRYFWMDEVDHALAKNRFIDNFVFFYGHYIEDKYFVIDRRTLDNENDYWALQHEFTVRKIKVREKELKNEARKTADAKRAKELVNQGFQFYGYEHSAYDYDKFDSFPEKQLADYINHILDTEPSTDEYQPFWIRNQREVFFEYGSHKYFPDFIVFWDRVIYVLEMKGAHIVSQKKAELLIFSLKDAPGLRGKLPDRYEGVVVLSNVVANFKGPDDFPIYADFLKSARSAWDRFVGVQKELKPNDAVPIEDRFKTYIPAFKTLEKPFRQLEKSQPLDPDGWIQVPIVDGDYPRTVFAVLVRSEDLSLAYQINSWIILESTVPKDIEDLCGRVVLAHHQDINDDAYGKRHLTLRRISVQTHKIQGGLFPEQIVVLSGDAEGVEPFEVDSQCKIRAVEYMRRG